MASFLASMTLAVAILFVVGIAPTVAIPTEAGWGIGVTDTGYGQVSGLEIARQPIVQAVVGDGDYDDDDRERERDERREEEREQELDDEDRELDDRDQLLDDRDNELDDRRRDLTEYEQDLEAYERDLQEWEHTLDEREREQDEREAEQNQRERELDQSEGMLHEARAFDTGVGFDDGLVTVILTERDGTAVPGVDVVADDDRVGRTDDDGLLRFASDATRMLELELTDNSSKVTLCYEIRGDALVLVDEEHTGPRVDEIEDRREREADERETDRRDRERDRRDREREERERDQREREREHAADRR